MSFSHIPKKGSLTPAALANSLDTEPPPIIGACFDALPLILSYVGTTEVGSVCRAFKTALSYTRHEQAVNLFDLESSTHLLSALEISYPIQTTSSTANRYLHTLTRKLDELRRKIPGLSPSFPASASLILEQRLLEPFLRQALQAALTRICTESNLQKLLTNFGLPCSKTIDCADSTTFFPSLRSLINRFRATLPEDERQLYPETAAMLFDERALWIFFQHAYQHNFVNCFARVVDYPEGANLDEKIDIAQRWLHSEEAQSCEELDCSGQGLTCRHSGLPP